MCNGGKGLVTPRAESNLFVFFHFFSFCIYISESFGSYFRFSEWTQLQLLCSHSYQVISMSPMKKVLTAPTWLRCHIHCAHPLVFLDYLFYSIFDSRYTICLTLVVILKIFFLLLLALSVPLLCTNNSNGESCIFENDSIHQSYLIKMQHIYEEVWKVHYVPFLLRVSGLTEDHS